MPGQGSARREWASLLFEVPAVCVLMVMALHVAANAIMRTYFDAPIENTLELVQYWYMPIVALLGIMAAQTRGQNLVADLLYARLTSFGKAVSRALSALLILGVSAGFVWFGLAEALHGLEIKMTAGVTGLTIWPVLFLVPLTFAVVGIAAVIELFTEEPDPAQLLRDEQESGA